MQLYQELMLESNLSSWMALSFSKQAVKATKIHRVFYSNLMVKQVIAWSKFKDFCWYQNWFVFQVCQKFQTTKQKSTLVSWSPKIQSKLNKIQKTFRKQGFFDNFCSILTIFQLWLNLSTPTHQSGLFWHTWKTKQFWYHQKSFTMDQTIECL